MKKKIAMGVYDVVESGKKNISERFDIVTRAPEVNIPGELTGWRP
jgi:hypothetical protein